MAQHSGVPKFGNWENEQDVPYTQYFDKARKGKKGGKMINPNNPQDNMDAYTDNTRPIQSPPFRNGVESDARVREGSPKPKHEQQLSKGDGDLRRLTDSPVHHDNSGRKTSIEHNRNVSSGGVPKRAGRQTCGPDRSVEHPHLHPHHQARTGGKGSGVSSPSWDKKSSEGIHGLAPNKPGRSRLRPVAQGDETLDKSAAVPKLGEWDENDPASADGFTGIFENLSKDKKSISANEIAMPDDVSNSYGYKQANGRIHSTWSCFLWGKR